MLGSVFFKCSHLHACNQAIDTGQITLCLGGMFSAVVFADFIVTSINLGKMIMDDMDI